MSNVKATICPPFCEGMSDACEQTWGGPPDSLGVEGGVERRPAPPPTFSQKSLFPLPSARHRCGLRDLVLCCPLVSTSKLTVPGSPAPNRKPCRCFPCCLVRCRQQPCETAVIIAAFSVKKAHLCSSIWKIFTEPQLFAKHFARSWCFTSELSAPVEGSFGSAGRRKTVNAWTHRTCMCVWPGR